MVGNIREVLEALGYSNIRESLKDFRMAPVYRESQNSSSLSVRKDSGRWIDYAMGKTGDLADLVQMSLKLTTIDEAADWLKNNNINFTVHQPPRQRITTPKVFEKESLLRLADDTSYWEGRGIPSDVVKGFGGGLAFKGKMAGRYVFPIYNSREDIVGWAGRDIFDNSSRPKWKLLGTKEEWVYPAFLNHKKLQRDKMAILVESIGDCLALYNAGIENVLVTFGIHLSSGILNYLLRLDLNCIVIAFNNDAVDGKSAGNNAADVVRGRLLRLFDPHQVEIALPDKKDFGAMLPEEIQEWHRRRTCQPVASSA